MIGFDLPSRSPRAFTGFGLSLLWALLEISRRKCAIGYVDDGEGARPAMVLRGSTETSIQAVANDRSSSGRDVVLNTFSLRLVALAMAVVAASPAAAQEDVVIFPEVPTTEELEFALFGKEPSPKTRGLTRGIRFHNRNGSDAGPAQNPTRPTSVERRQTAFGNRQGSVCSGNGTGASEPAPKGTALGFNLLFAFDSVEMVGDSHAFLNRLGEVMSKPENAGRTLVVMGHTDATGGDCYNLRLSAARADAVRDYLVSAWQIGEERLQTRGFGERRLLPGTDPVDGINRRVEFVAVE